MNTKFFIYLSEILNHPVVDNSGRVAGRLCDIVMRVNEEVYPRASGLVIRRGFIKKEFAYVPGEQIKEIQDVLKLKVDCDQIVFQPVSPKYDFTLCKDILDRQVVDTDNRKVVRVNDVHLLRVDNNLYLAHVDVGLRGLVRRLEWTAAVDSLVRDFTPESSYLTREEFIPWKNTQLLNAGRYKNVLRLDVARNKLSQIHPTDIAEIMEDLDIFEQLSLFKSLDVPVQRKVFTDLATGEKQDLMDHLDDAEAVNLLENIPADEATDLLLSLPKERTLQFMRLMGSETAKKLRSLLGFAKNSAGGLMTKEYLALLKNATVQDGIELIKASVDYPGNIYHLYVVDEENKLLGLTSIRRFISADPSVPLLQTCYPKKIFVHTDDGMETIALLLEKYKFTAVPVLNDDGILVGVVTSDDVMEELISLAWIKYKDKLT